MPINPFRIAKEVGLRVEPLPVERRDKFLGEYDPQKQLISYNPDESANLQRLTVARMLGHYMMDQDSPKQELKHKSLLDYLDWEERKADHFAYCLLMPELVIKALIDGEKITDAKRLTKLLGVSLDNLAIRLKYLGYA